MLRHIIFDFDGTLADTQLTIVTTMQAAIAERGLEQRTAAQCRATIGLKLESCFSHLYPGITDGEAARCAEVYRRIFDINKTRIPPALFPGVRETLASLASRGLTMSIVSSRHHCSLDELTLRLGIRQWLRPLLGGDDVERPKPDPCPVETTLRLLHGQSGRTISPEEVLVVGDASYDILMGKAAGSHTCGVTYGNGTTQELLAAGAGHVIDRFGLLAGVADSLMAERP